MNARALARRWFGMLLCLFAMLLTGCSGCSSEEMARLSAAQGEVQRDYEAKVQQWEATQIGATFDFGDGLRTQSEATATVTFDDGALMNLDPETTVRFLRTAPDSNDKGIDVETGRAIVEAGATELRLQTQMGVAVLSPGTVAQLGKGEKGIRFLVTVGQARLEGDDKTIELEPGRGLEIGLGMAILDEFGPAVEQEKAPTPEATVAKPEPVEDLPIVATVDGNGVTIKKPGSKTFERLKPGQHTLEPGSQIKLGKSDSTTVARGKTKASLSGPGTYEIVGDGPHIVEPVAGNMTLTADGRDVSAEIPGGKVTALGSDGLSIGDIRIVQGRSATVRARVGKLRIEVGDERSTLNAGESAVVQNGKTSISGRGPDFFDLSTGAGGSLLVHDPSPPTAINVRFGKQCPHLGILERLGGANAVASSVGSGSANLKFDKGAHRYRVRCLSEEGKLGAPVASGRITVYRDAGTAALPRKAPATLVNTDGRSYTVLYQNLLPSITVRWPNAPKANSYSLRVTSGGKTQTLSAKSASFSFQSGQLKEGQHVFQFKSSEGRKSRPSTATIRFDNAAPKASIKTPVNGSFGAGQSVHVSGIALPGWEVSAQGQPVTMDGEQRFAGSATAGPRGLVLQFSHPKRGVHHYLRRASGATQ